MEKKLRFLSLDILRGLTIIFMIFVNDPVLAHVYPILLHASWNGITPTDYVFPMFLFIVGFYSIIHGKSKRKIESLCSCTKGTLRHSKFMS